MVLKYSCRSEEDVVTSFQTSLGSDAFSIDAVSLCIQSHVTDICMLEQLPVA